MELRRKTGDAAEDLAAAFLEKQGYQVLERNVLYRFGELDLVAKKDDVYCFVEVRMRSSLACGEPFLTVMSSKQRKVIRSAMKWLQREHLTDRVMVRFDVISIVGQGPRAKLEHLPGAFDAGF